jgi:tetratricopeptide (TPR) repeat protein
MPESHVKPQNAFWCFGYGSLINNESRCGNSTSNQDECEDGAVFVTVSPEFGYVRAFCSRSSTGFTALGLIPRKTADYDDNVGITGVLFPVTSQRLYELDEREKDYRRQEVPHELISNARKWQGNQHKGLQSNKARNNEVNLHTVLSPTDIVYTYVPHAHVESTVADTGSKYKDGMKAHDIRDQPTMIQEATDEYPILQTYVDTCLSGCLQWGGVSCMDDFVTSTCMWSIHYLNDCPLSRRPWIHRPYYLEIDKILEKYASHTFYSSRKHAGTTSSIGSATLSSNESRNNTGVIAPASPMAATPTGLWGCPPRNPHFVGREDDVQFVQYSLTNYGYAVVCGLGGMGKSTLATEYCYRHAASSNATLSSSNSIEASGGTSYGLVIYLRAESAASISADIRRFAIDAKIIGTSASGSVSSMSNSNIINTTNNADDVDGTVVVEEFRRCIAALQTPTLLIFDNFEVESDMTLHEALEPYLPTNRSISRTRSVATDNSSNTDSNHANAISSHSNLGGALLHVIVTKRGVSTIDDHHSGGSSHSHMITSTVQTELFLNALSPQQSLLFLRQALQLSLHECHQSSSNQMNSYSSSLSTLPSTTSNEKTHNENISDMYENGSTEDDDRADLMALAERLAHLPLALAQAATFMARVDISARDYLHRLSNRRAGAGDALDSVHSSLSVALERIGREVPEAVHALLRLAWLSPDCVTKNLLHDILNVAVFRHGPQGYYKLAVKCNNLNENDVHHHRNLATHAANMGKGMSSNRKDVTDRTNVGIPTSTRLWALSHGIKKVKFLAGIGAAAVVAAGVTGIALLAGGGSNSNSRGSHESGTQWKTTLTTGTLTLAVLVSGVYISGQSTDATDVLDIDSIHEKSSTTITTSTNTTTLPVEVDEYVVVDRVWEVLKNFGLLSVRGPRRARVASIHRLQLQYVRERCHALACGLVTEELPNSRVSQSSFHANTSKQFPTPECKKAIPTLCLEQCIWALSSLWTDQTKSGSSVSSDGGVLGHVQTLATHVSNLLRTPDNTNESSSSAIVVLMRRSSQLALASLLTNAAAHVILVQSRFETAYMLLTLAVQLQELQPNNVVDDQVHSSSHHLHNSLMGRTLHLYGTTCRLGGHYEAARSHLDKALRLRLRQLRRQRDATTPTSDETSSGLLSHVSLSALWLRDVEDSLTYESHINISINNNADDSDHCNAVLAVSLVADTLHELGIVHLRAGQLEEAEAQLQDSLQLKQAIASELMQQEHNRQGNTTGAESTTQSATMHQLAMVATVRRKYAEAEALLGRALQAASTETETDISSSDIQHKMKVNTNTFNSHAHRRHIVSKAAMTQQLGKVLFRRGKYHEANIALRRSLTLYAEVYGPSALHINVAAVHQALASVLCVTATSGTSLSATDSGNGSNDATVGAIYTEALSHLEQALLIRTSVLPEDHPDVLQTYADIAQCTADSVGTNSGSSTTSCSSNYEQAVDLWVKQGQRARRALHHATVATPQRNTDTSGYRHDTYVRHLLGSLYCRRQLAKRVRSMNIDNESSAALVTTDTALITELSAEIIAVKKMYGDGTTGSLSVRCDVGKAEKGKSSVSGVARSTVDSKDTGITISIAIHNAIQSCRSGVRSAARRLKKMQSENSKTVSAQTTISKPLRDVLNTVPAMLTEVMSAVSAATSAQSIDQIIIRECERFCQNVRTTLNETQCGGSPIVLAEALFEASDQLRAGCNKVGMRLED